MKTVTYEWSWPRLSLFQIVKDGVGGYSSRVFTLWPPWAWYHILCWVGYYPPDPFQDCKYWLKKNGHWDDEDFYRAVCWWYANHSEPGQLVRLNPRLFLQ